MKIKKLIASIVAAAVAVTSSIVVPTTVNAADMNETVLYEFDDSQLGVYSTFALSSETAAAICAAQTSVVFNVDSDSATNYYLQSTSDWSCWGWGSMNTDLTLDADTATGDPAKYFIADKPTSGGWQLVFSADTKIDAITVAIDGAAAETIYDVTVDAVAGMEFAAGGTNYTVSADILADAGVTADNLAECTLTANVVSVGSSKEICAIVGDGDPWTENQFYWSNSFAVGEVEITLDIGAVTENPLETGVLFHAKDIVVGKFVLSVPAEVAVTGVELDKTTASAVVGGTVQLTATVLPENATNKNVTWDSDAEDVATVDETGLVTAKAVGDANITVTTEDGTKTATCAVTVTAATVAVTGVELDKTELELEKGDSEALTATVAPDTATNKNVTWSSDAENVATVDQDGNVTAVGAGDAVITVTTEDGGFTDTCAVTVAEAAPAEVYTYKYDGSPIELTLEVPTWDATRLNGSKDFSLTPTGVTMMTTTFAELKELYSGIAVKDWAVNTITEGADASKASIAIFIKTGDSWTWHAYYNSSVAFADVTDIADTDVIMEIGYQINYDATGSDFKAGDIIVINGEEEDEDLESGEYGGGDASYQELGEDEIPELNNDKAYTDIHSGSSTYAQVSGTTYRFYTLVDESALVGKTEASIVVKSKTTGKAFKLSTAKAYKKLSADVSAGEGQVYLAFVIENAPAATDTTSGYYTCDFEWSDITLS